MLITSLSVLAEFLLFVSSAVLWVKDSPFKRANRFLGIAFALGGLLSVWLLLMYYAYSLHTPMLLHVFLPLDHILIMFIGPACWFYVVLLFNPARHISPRRLVWHALPALPAVTYTVYFALLPASERAGLLTGETDPRLWMDVVLDTLFCVQCASYFLICLVKVIRLRKSGYIIVANGFQTPIRWMVLFLVLSLTGLFLYMPLNILQHYMKVQITWGAVCIALPAIYLFIQSEFTTGLSMQLTNPFRKHTGHPIHLTEEVIARFLAKIVEAMEISQLFLEPKCSLRVVSAQTNIPVHHITHVIKVQLHINFIDFVNEYRSKFAHSLMEDKANHHKLIEVIGNESGFASRLNFHDAFKKLYDISPSDYLATQKRKIR